MKIKYLIKNYFSTWWRNIDRYILFSMILLVVIGILLVYSGSPPVAARLGYDDMHFIHRHLVFVLMSFVIMLIISCFSLNLVKYMSFIGVVVGFLFLLLLLGFASDIKGAKRWITIFHITIQPSEFVKVFFIILTAWILSLKSSDIFIKSRFFYYSASSWLCFASLLILQPDLGMTIVVSIVWGGQLFLAGLPIPIVFVFIVLILLGVLGAYFFFPHVANRIDSFLDSSNELSYQVKKSLDAFENGGFTGVGPGGGVVKMHLPDSHTDFIFAVAGEEMGAVLCILIVSLYCFIVVKSLLNILNEERLFVVYTVAGIAMLFGFQAIINIGVSLSLLPTKGMTLPFISYGGSSFMSISLSAGVLLSLTKKRYGKILKTNRILLGHNE